MKAPRQYRRQPVKVQAIQYTGDNAAAVCLFIEDDFVCSGDQIEIRQRAYTETVNATDWVVREGRGLPYVVGDQEFLRTHGR